MKRENEALNRGENALGVGVCEFVVDLSEKKELGSRETDDIALISESC